ncbi:MAG: hypothetical protein M1829_001309 [Trizodia sp. TS-e1964]|nr:MAG: hypothetical protein M1829_001309 [Trizodia sp. TS-e1964]
MVRLTRLLLMGFATLAATSNQHESPSQTDTQTKGLDFSSPDPALLADLAAGHELARRACLANAPCASNIDHYISSPSPLFLNSNAPLTSFSEYPVFKGPRLIWISPSRASPGAPTQWTYYLMPISKAALERPEDLLTCTLEVFAPQVQQGAYGTATAIKSQRLDTSVGDIVGQRPAPTVYGVGVVAMFHEFAVSALFAERDASLYAQSEPRYREWALGVLELLRRSTLEKIPFEYKALGGLLDDLEGA